MIDQLLFVVYFIVLLFILYRIIKRKKIPLNFWTVAAIFSFKVMLGCLYGWIFFHYYHGDDTWNFFNDSVADTQKLIQQPAQFLLDFLPNKAFRQATSWPQFLNFYSRDLEYCSTVKLLAIFNVFSHGNYYVDVLLFQFVIVWGPLLLFKLMSDKYPTKVTWLIVAIFFIPSISFWLSGIRAEGLLLLSFALILYYTNKRFQNKKFMGLIWIVLGFLGILIFRLPYLLVLLPAYAGWIISSTNSKRTPLYYFGLIYLTCVGIFFSSLLISPARNLSAPLIQKQQDFFRLHGNTRFELDSLKPDPTSFIKILPQAFVNTFARPYIWEAKGPLQWLSALEVMGAWIVIILVVTRPEKNWRELVNDPLLVLMVLYGLSQVLIIGFIVPYPGAIVRYKIIPELFLAIVAVVAIRWNKTEINYNNK
ncbi:MAG: hypothetical protein C5B59_09185 [Bacteroidetes bacterium]|nr:MAG: hypothetical protein C5B59_09185 [Bacteroidota bacterium]